MAGKLTATATQPAQRSVTSRGQGSLMSTANAKYSQAAGLPGHGTISAAAYARKPVVASPHGRGVLTIPTTKQIYNITGAAPGHGALAGSGFPKYLFPGSVSGHGSAYATAVPVVAFDPLAFPNAYGYGSSFTVSPAVTGPGMMLLYVVTSGYIYPTKVGYGAIPTGGGSQATLTLLQQLSLDNQTNAGYLSVFYGFSGSSTLTVSLNGNGYYAAVGANYLNANTITYESGLQWYATADSLVLNNSQSTPTYTGVGVWGSYTGGISYATSGSPPYNYRGGQTEASLALQIYDVGPTSVEVDMGFSASQGAYIAGVTALLHA